MKNLNLKRLSSLMFAGYGMLQASTVFAVAGDTIGNTAVLNYSIGGTPQTLIESAPGAGNSNPGTGAGTSTDFVEDRRLNVTVAAAGGTTLAPNAVGGIGFTVTNNSNAVLDMSFTNEQGGGTFNTTDAPITYYVEDGTTPGSFQIGEDTLVTFLDEMGIGETRTVYLVDQMPDDLTVADGDTADVRLIVQVAEVGTGPGNQGADIVADDSGSGDTAGVDDVFADTVAGPATTDGALDGNHSAEETFTIATADLTVTKISTVLRDPINNGTNPKAIPGAHVTYTITVANAGAPNVTSADVTQILDALPDGVAANTHSVTLDPDFDDATGTPTSGAGLSFEIDTTGTARPSNSTFYCRADGADGAGCNYSGGSGGTVDLDQADGTGIPGMGIEAGYNAGELKPGESIIIQFNAIID